MSRPQKRTRRIYSDEDRAAALATLDSNGGNVRHTARQLGISDSTIRLWRDNHLPEVAELRAQKKSDLSDIFEEVARTYLARALEADAVAETKGQAAVTAAAIAVDKLRLLRDESTSIEEVRDDLSADERAARVAELLDRARTRRDRRAPNN